MLFQTVEMSGKACGAVRLDEGWCPLTLCIYVVKALHVDGTLRSLY